MGLFRNLFFCLLALCSFALAQSPPDSSLGKERRLGVAFADPLRNWDALAFDYISLQQVIGGLDQAAVRRWGSPGAGLPRFGEMVAVGWANLAIGHYVHELGHDLTRDWWHASSSLDFSDWWPMPWPAYERRLWTDYQKWMELDSSSNAARQVLKEDRWRTTSGINMEEHAARLLFERSNDLMAWDEALAFSFRKLSALTYQVYTGEAFGAYQGDGRSDPHGYVEDLQDQGIKAGIADWYRPALFSDLLSFRLWEALWMDLHFLAGGPRTISPWKLRIGGWMLTPPLVQLDYSAQGAYHEVIVPIETPSHWIAEPFFGRDADWMAAGDLDVFRIGTTLWTPAFTLKGIRFRFQFEGAMTCTRSQLTLQGGTVMSGLDLRWMQWGLDGEMRWSQDDFVQNDVQHHSNGFSPRLFLLYWWSP